jgi:hypothetical protein
MGLFLNLAVERREPCHEEMVTWGEFVEPGDEVAPFSWTLVLDSILVHNRCLKMILIYYVIFWHHYFHRLLNDTDLPEEMISLLFAVGVHDVEEFIKVVVLAQQLPQFTSDTLTNVMNHSVCVAHCLIAVT